MEVCCDTRTQPSKYAAVDGYLDRQTRFGASCTVCQGATRSSISEVDNDKSNGVFQDVDDVDQQRKSVGFDSDNKRREEQFTKRNNERRRCNQYMSDDYITLDC